MEVEMEHGLTGLLSDVGDDTVALYPQFFGNLGNDLKDVGHYRAVALVDSSGRGNVHLGNDKEMGGSLRIDVIEGQTQIILIDFVGRDLTGDNFTEQTIRQWENLL